MVTTLVGDSTSVDYVDGMNNDVNFNQLYGLTYDSLGNYIVIADSGNHVIRQLDLYNFEVTTIVGAGSSGYVDGCLSCGDYPAFHTPLDVLYLPDQDGIIFVADHGNKAIRAVLLGSNISSL